MTISKKLKIHLLAIHLFFFTFLWLPTPSMWMIICLEVILFFSFFVGFNWLKKIARHFEMINMSMENIKSQDFSIRMKKTGQKDFDLLVEVYNYMIDKLRSERIATSEINNLLASIIQASPSGIVLFDFDHRIKAINPAASALLNKTKEELMAKTPLQLAGNISEILLTDEGKWSVIHQGGQNIIRAYCGKFINQGFETKFVLFEDFSDEIHRVEKKAYEKLIRMMGHEVNNTAGAVNSVLDTYIRKHKDVYASTFQIVKERNENLSEFMKRLSELARLPAPEKSLFDLMPLVKKTVQLIDAKFKHKNIDWTISEELGSMDVMADRLQFEQVIINVLTNAAEAIQQLGKIWVAWSISDKQVTIRNNGIALTTEEERQIFTPFYSNKPDGQGIGLTLSREVLQQHGFKFHLKTIGDGITEFRIQF